jgi:hypothetical protein
MFWFSIPQKVSTAVDAKLCGQGVARAPSVVLARAVTPSPRYRGAMDGCWMHKPDRSHLVQRRPMKMTYGRVSTS